MNITRRLVPAALSRFTVAVRKSIAASLSTACLVMLSAATVHAAPGDGIVDLGESGTPSGGPKPWNMTADGVIFPVFCLEMSKASPSGEYSAISAASVNDAMFPNKPASVFDVKDKIERMFTAYQSNPGTAVQDAIWYFTDNLAVSGAAATLVANVNSYQPSPLYWMTSDANNQFVGGGPVLKDWGDFSQFGAASHIRVSGVYLGNGVDGEEGSSNSTATYDDDLNTGMNDDEDGVTGLPSTVVVGQTFTITVDANVAGRLNAWIDWNDDGTLTNSERICLADLAIPAGPFTLPTITVPGTALTNASVGVRFRFTSGTGQGNSPTGDAPNGEVEDYITFVDGVDYDFGDLVDTGSGTGSGNYESLLVNDGPRHLIANNTQRLGATINGENDARQSGFANGDGTTDNGVTIPSLTAGGSASFTISANVAGYLSAWVDWNGDGDFADPSETITTSMAVSAGSNNLAVSVPASAVTGQPIGSRFRFTVDAGTADTPYGLSPSGEVEDYGVTVTPGGPLYDFGDLIDPTVGTGGSDYQTLLANNGPRHQIVNASQRLGNAVDYESDANQSGFAYGDDAAGTDDEDGISFASDFYLGLNNTIFVNANVGGYLNAWIDWNGDGDFDDAGENIFSDYAVFAATQGLAVTVPPGAIPGNTGARFRFTTGAGQATTPYGSAPNGEVEDYEIFIAEAGMDYGDLPDGSSANGPGNYQTYLSSNGPRHAIGDGNYYLGYGAFQTHVDYEADANISGFANGDAHDDGVNLGTIVQGQTSQVTVTASQNGYLNAWIDWNRDGDFADAGEKIAHEQLLTLGANTLSVSAPATAIIGQSIGARFRFTSTAGQATEPVGEAADGEVEDYGLIVADPSQVFDFGDLVDTAVGTGTGNYQTLINDNGPRHTIADSAIRLGATVTAEAAAYQSGFASGDTGDDGVTLPPALVSGYSATFVVNANVSGRLNAWVDWNGDGDFLDNDEWIAVDRSVSAGNNNITITVSSSPFIPESGKVGARFRFTTGSNQATSPTGLAPNGEVEDYEVMVSNQPLDFGDLADTAAGTGAGNYESLYANDGPRHMILKPTEHLGETINFENDAKQSGLAGGDGNFDDGVIIPSLIAGQTAILEVYVSLAGHLNAWIDWNGDGDFADTNERVVTVDRAVNAGWNNVQIPVPAGITNGLTVGARFRYTELPGGATTPYGWAPSGEVEDYAVYLGIPYDFGDLVDTGAGTGAGNHETLLANNGPRHVILGNVRLGATIDPEANAGQSGFAAGDGSDEDGVTIPSLTAGQSATLVVFANTVGRLSAWIDWNNDGDFADSGEALAIAAALPGGNYNLNIFVPAGASTGVNLGARFRFTTYIDQATTPYGEASDGEVEDYLVTVNPGTTYDFGDLVDAAGGTSTGNYDTLLGNGGPRHVIVSSTQRLGATIDAEADAGQSGFAAGDGSDEDGVTIPTLTAGQNATLVVNANVAGRLNAWIDWNNDGDFADSGEIVSTDLALAAGNNNLSVSVPAGATTGVSLGARFRFTTGTGQATTPYGEAPNGEIEDYAVTVAASCPVITLNPATLPNGTVGTAYSQTITASGGTAPYTYAVTTGSLPAGLMLNGSTGAITGTPTTAATSNFTITATDSKNCPGTRSFTVTIATTSCPTVVITPNPLPNGTTGVAYSANPSASPAATYTWTATGLPTGLAINATTGAITGTPTASGVATITATATINGSACSGTTSLTVSCPVIGISPASLANGLVGTPYSATLLASGGTPSYSWTSTGLPLGLVLNSSTGAISGTPAAAGNATITVTDANGCSASIPLKIIDPITTLCIGPDPKFPGTINIVFTRSEDPAGVEYCLEFAASLGNPTTWGEILLAPANLDIVDNGDGTETVTIRDIEALTGLSGGQGFVRLIAKMNGNPVRTSSVQGWKETTLGLCCQTYNVPFLRCATFTGTVSSTRFGLIFDGEDLSNLLDPNVSYYAEVISGDNVGQRFDVVSATGSAVALANDSDLCAATPPFNTLTGPAPINIVGDTLVIRPHWTLNEVFPPASFGASNDQTTADQIQIHAGGTWKIYWLYAKGGNPIWVDTADAGLNDQGGTVLPPGQGVFFNNRTAAATVLSYGEVRANRFVRPLCAGLNLVGGGYPVTESPALRVMNNTTFTGTTSFTTADSILIWNNDATQSNSNDYTTRWLLNSTNPYKRWVKVGDSTAASEDNNLIFAGDRASFIRRATARATFSYPAPWAP